MKFIKFCFESYAKRLIVNIQTLEKIQLTFGGDAMHLIRSLISVNYL